MPTAAVVAILSDVAATYVADALIFDLVATTTLDWVASYTVLQAGSSFLIGAGLRSAMSGDGEQSPQAFAQQANARTHIIRSAVANRSIVYGEAVVSGPLLFAATDPSNSTLYMAVALAGHECESVEAIYFNDEEIGARDADGWVTADTYADKARIIEHLGQPGQAAAAVLVSTQLGWTEAHTLDGITYLEIVLRWDRDIFPRGVPNIKARIKGKKVYDPRTGLTAWSDNWALCCRDYLTADYGLRCTSAEVSDASFIAAANIADEAVTLADDATEPRYTANAAFDLGMTPRAIMEALLSGGHGALTWPAGVYTIHAGVYDAPTLSLNVDNLRGALHVRARPPKQDLYNAVRGTFVDPAQSWQPTDFPAVTNATYEAQDGALRLYRDIALPVTTSSARAQRLAKIALEKSRQGITVEAPCTLAAFKAQIWDVVTLSIDHLGWTDKEFRVTGWRLSETGGVDLVLQEESAACYAWSAEETVTDPAPDTRLPDPFTVGAPGTPSVAEALYETTGSAGYKTRAEVTWGASVSATVVGYEPAWKLASVGDWTALPVVTEAAVTLFDVAPETYDFRVRAISTLGVRSPWSGTRTQEILGLTAAPADVNGFTVIKSGGFAQGQWTLHPDLDVRQGGRIVVRHAPVSSGATWESSVVVEEFNGDAVNGLLPLMTGTYLVKAVDSTGHYSATATSFVATEGMVSGFTTVGTITFDPAFIGSYSNVGVVAAALRLVSSETWDASEDIDAGDDVDGGSVAASGYADFTSVLDLTTSAVRRLQATLTATCYDVADYIDGDDDIDSAEDLDGAAINDCDATLYVATTPDDPAGSPTWSTWSPFFVGDFGARAYKFRLALASGNPSHTIAVSALAVSAKIPT